jgi:nitrite reductase (NADH) large subunit
VRYHHPAMTRKYRCTVCGYVHEGDGPPEQCPVCGVGAELFELEEDVAAPATSGPLVAVTPTPAQAGWVVLGGGIAALAAVTAARAADAQQRIVLVHREPELPYDRLSLTRLLAGEVGRDALLIHPAAWFAERRIELVRGEARRLDREGHAVVLGDGRRLPYQKLVIATGAHAFVPPIPGVRRDGVHVLRTVADADAILARALPGSRVACIGAGLLGLETAGGLAHRGLDVAVLEGADRLLPRQLAKGAAERLAAYLGSLGIRFRFGVGIEEIAGDETARGVVLADGGEIPADLVVLAAGVRPNAGLARAAGLATGRGLVVDDGLRTSDPDILAAGDVTEHRGVTWGLWTVAMEQGTLAGRALAGASVVFEGKPAPTQLKVVGMPVFSVGRFDPAGSDEHVFERADEKHLLRIVTKNGVVLGGNLVGDLSLAAALKRAVHEGLPPSALGL